MASIVLSNIGSALGNQLLPGIGGKILGSVGGKFGREFDKDIGWTSTSFSNDGPRLESMNVQDSRYGTSIPVVFGRVRVAGNIIWISDLIEASHDSGAGGGKGGAVGMGGGSSRTTYSYSAHCAIAICAGEIGGIETIWADSKIIYQNGLWKAGVVASASIYNGSAEQEVDSLLQSFIGVGQVPAYRGIAYIVLESLQLGNFGNRLPNITFEVLPKSTGIRPEWMGYVDAGICNRSTVIRNGGMKPIIVEGSSSKARRVILGGYALEDGKAKFEIIEYDITGNAPVEQSRTFSDEFNCVSMCDHSWSVAADNRFVVLYIQDTNATPTHNFVIYDAENNSFGQIYSINLQYSGSIKQVAWIDPQHFVIPDCVGQNRGVRVFVRAGCNIVDLGYYDVWGVGSANSLMPLFYAQFTPAGGGLLYYLADNAPAFTAIFVRSIIWQNNGLLVGASYTLTSGYSTGSGSAAQANFISTGEGEWTLVFSNVLNLQLLSFIPGLSSAVITRNWKKLVNNAFYASSSHFPMVFGNKIVVLQRSLDDNYYRLSEIAINESDFSFILDGIVVENFANPYSNFCGIKIDGTRLLSVVQGAYDNISQFAIIKRCNTGDSLGNVVANILCRAGYLTENYDVSNLVDISIDGFVVNDQMDAFSAIAPLKIYEPFDVVESGTLLKAVKHGDFPVAEILGEDCCAVKGCNSGIVSSRSQELDLPIEVTVDYIDASRDYEIGSQRARRFAARGAKVMAKLNLPIVCTSLKAKQLAEARLFKAWAERDEVVLYLSKKWLSLEPGDVVKFGDKKIRIVYVRFEDGIIMARGLSIPISFVGGAELADAGNSLNNSDIKVIGSILFMMDLPLLRNSDDQPGIYVAVSGIDGWSGASLWRAVDGTNYNNIGSYNSPATAGIATTALLSAPVFYLDKTNFVNVQLLHGALESCSYENLLSGANVALLGDEIIQFQNATLIGTGLYRLENILRGRRGTESAVDAHVLGENFVLLKESSVQFIPAQLGDRGRINYFRALSNGQSFGAVSDVACTYNLTTLRPLAPVHLSGYRAGGISGDYTLSWKRRARKYGEWADNHDVPLDEDLELYDVEIMNGTVVKRCFSNLTVSTVTYSSAMQTEDWGESIPLQFSINIYQISSRYGRGQKASQ